MSCDTMQHPSDYLLWAILLSYLFFAAQILYQTRWKLVDKRSAVALLSLMVVFILCGLAHWTGGLPSDQRLSREYLYQLLLLVHITLIFSNQAGVISRMLEHNENTPADHVGIISE